LRNLTSDGLDELKTVEAAHKEYRSAATIDGKYFVISGTINKENQERIILAALDTGGQVLWERTYDTRRAAYAIDPLGRLLALTTQEDGSRPRQSQLLELPSLKLIRTMNYFPALGPDELGYWMTGEYKGGGTYSLFRGSQEQPVVNFGTDFLPQGAYASFSPDGSTIAAPTFDGTVTLILIETLREKMTSAGFGR